MKNIANKRRKKLQSHSIHKKKSSRSPLSCRVTIIMTQAKKIINFSAVNDLK
jgi:hypothetical protein